jgi:hypothetical protein
VSQPVTPELVLRKRQELGLSRQAFAQRVGITGGALWRIEVKGAWKPGEFEKFHAVAPEWFDADFRPPETPVRHEKPAATVVTLVDPEPASENVSTPSSVALITELQHATTTTQAPIELPQLPRELTPVELTHNDGVPRFSNSELQTYKDCLRRWYMAYYRQLTPKYESPVGARAVGDRIHRALRWMYVGDPARRLDALQALEVLIEVDRRALVERYGSWDHVPAETSKQFVKEADLERVMISGYLDWLKETGADSELEFTGSEQYVEADLPGVAVPVKIIARLDVRVRRISDGVRLFLDHKTNADFGTAARLLPLDEQMLTYILVEQLQNGEDTYVAGALYNMLKRSKRTATATPPFYKRVEVRHNPAEMKNFMTRLRGTIGDVLATRARLDAGHDHRLAAYPRPSRDCVWKCQFFSVCGSMDDGSYVDALIDAHFTTGDPTAYYVKQ